MSKNYDELFGPAGKSDYKIRDIVSFREGGKTLRGEIIHIAAPGRTPVTHKHTPTSYQIDCGDGWPHICYASDLIVSED
jgi:hypothetical protein